jgi:hypothetical protein
VISRFITDLCVIDIVTPSAGGGIVAVAQATQAVLGRRCGGRPEARADVQHIRPNLGSKSSSVLG